MREEILEDGLGLALEDWQLLWLTVGRGDLGIIQLHFLSKP